MSNRKITKNKIIKHGTDYGGWYLPTKINLDGDSIIYSAGVGEDISFDLIMSDKYNSNIFLIDPTKRSKIHFEEVKKYYQTKNYIFSGDIQKDYNIIQKLSPNMNKIKYIDMGLWNKKDNLKFYKPTNNKYISHSLIKGMVSDKYDIVEVDTIKNIMTENNHEHIDLLKLDIEGAEIEVIENMLEDEIYPTYLLVEFDLYLKGKERKRTTNLIRKIKEKYKIIKNDHYNITFAFSSPNE